MSNKTISDETLKAIRQELELFRISAKKFPDIPIKEVKYCGCVGPLPECRCAKRERLIKKFLKSGHGKE